MTRPNWTLPEWQMAYLEATTGMHRRSLQPLVDLCQATGAHPADLLPVVSRADTRLLPVFEVTLAGRRYAASPSPDRPGYTLTLTKEAS